MTRRPIRRGAAQRTYLGYRQHAWGEPTVAIVQGCHGVPLPLRLDLANHSPTGFEWGYAGSGPAQLALAILIDATADQETTMRLYQRFKAEIIAPIPRGGFEITKSQVLDWVEKNK